MRFGTRDRDVGLQRVSRLTRWLVAGTVGLVGVLSAVVAQALPGNSGTSAATTGSPSGATASPSASAPAPTPTSPTTTQDPGLSGGSSGSSSSSSDPNLPPSPPPVSTRHQSVASSGVS